MAQRRIVHVTLSAQEASDFYERAQREGKLKNLRQHNEKIRAESTWRWGWVTVADAPKRGDEDR